MLEYWMANNDSASNSSEFEIKEVLEDPSSAVLFAGYPPWLLYFAAGCCILFMLIGIPGNLITVAALFRTKKSRPGLTSQGMWGSVEEKYKIALDIEAFLERFRKPNDSFKAKPSSPSSSSIRTSGCGMCRARQEAGLADRATSKPLRNATAVFIMNLSVSDLMFCCFNLPLATSTFWQSSWTHGPLLCRLFPLLRYGLVAVSLFTVLAITINRYVMIGHPRLYPKLYRPKYLVLMVLATWVSGFGALVATWFERWGRFGLDPVIGSCSILPDVNGRSPKEFLFILAFLAPCIAIIVCYARIFYIVRKTALKSRRREKVTTDLAKASIDINYTKNFEDSAIGSSCGATLTTTENSGSPNKYRGKNHPSSLSSSTNVVDNHRDDDVSAARFDNENMAPISRELSSVESSKSEEMPEGCSSGMGNSKSEHVENHSRSARIDNSAFDNTDDFSRVLDRIGDLRERIADRDEARSNFERSIEFLPFIDTCADQQARKDNEIDSIPNLRFFDADSGSPKPSLEDSLGIQDGGRRECCLKVPQRFPRCSEKTGSRGNPAKLARTDSARSNESRKFQLILNTKSLDANDDGEGIARTKRFLDDVRQNSNGFLSPQSVRQIRYNSDISDEYASSRSDSPSERREYPGKNNVFRRESRFRSVRSRAFESGKMTAKDKKLLKMILVIFASFLVCYLPITITKTFKDVIDWRGLNIAGYILIYLTTCINPIIYVVMSSEYRSAYKNVLLCRSDSNGSNCKHQNAGNAPAGEPDRRTSRKNGHGKRESIY